MTAMTSLASAAITLEANSIAMSREAEATSRARTALRVTDGGQGIHASSYASRR